MSSLTKTAFVAELKANNPILAALSEQAGDDVLVTGFVDRALRRFSLQSRKATKVSADNAVVDGQTLYDYPSDAISIVKLLDSETDEEIGFSYRDEGSGLQYQPGVKVSRSTASLMEGDFYQDPLSNQSQAGVSGYDNFDVVYSAILDMDSIKDSELEAVTEFVLHLAYNYKSSGQAVAVEENVGDEIESLTDRDSTGAATTTKFVTTAGTAKMYTGLAAEALKRFNVLAKPRPYAIRG